MKSTPFYLNDMFMPLYKFLLIFAFMLGFASIFTGIGYGLFTYIETDLSFASSLYSGFLLFLKGAGISAVISLVGFLAFWKKHQIAHENCKKGHITECQKTGLFRFA